MKLPAQQLTQHLAKNLAPLYVISGDETLLVQEAADLVRTAASQAGFSERIRITVESGNEWGKAFYANAHSLSLFATKRFIELDFTTAKFNAANTKILQEYAAKPSDDTLVLIRTQKIDSKTEQSNWYKALDKIGIMIPLWPITLDQLPQWILQRAKKLNINLTKSAATLLAEQVEGNLLAAAQELEKLCLLNNNGAIDENIISSAVTDNAHYDIFALVDSALAGHHQRCLRIMDNLAAEDTEPTLILWALTRELRTLADMAKHVKQGASLSSLFPKYRIWEKRQSIVRAFLQRHQQDDCWGLLANAAQIDRMIKGAEKGNVWTQLQQFVLKML